MLSPNSQSPSKHTHTMTLIHNSDHLCIVYMLPRTIIKMYDGCLMFQRTAHCYCLHCDTWGPLTASRMPLHQSCHTHTTMTNIKQTTSMTTVIHSLLTAKHKNYTRQYLMSPGSKSLQHYNNCYNNCFAYFTIIACI